MKLLSALPLGCGILFANASPVAYDSGAYNNAVYNAGAYWNGNSNSAGSAPAAVAPAAAAAAAVSTSADSTYDASTSAASTPVAAAPAAATSTAAAAAPAAAAATSAAATSAGSCSILATLNRGILSVSGGAAAFDAAFPVASWLSADCILENHLPVMGSQPVSESMKLLTAVNVASAQTGVDARLLMVIIMQESHGQLTVVSTTAPDGSSSNGVMQCDGCASANGISGPVPQDVVNAMVIGGAQHFLGNLATNSDPFVALRLYNSGSADPNDLNNGIQATSAYVVQVASRLIGWRN